MSARLSDRMEVFSEKLDTLIVRVERMKLSLEDLVAKGEAIELPSDSDYERRDAELRAASEVGRKLSWKLAEISGELFEAGQMADEMAGHYWEARRLPKDHVGPA